MKYAIFDVETTGLGNRDEVIQFACVIADEEFKAQTLYNEYFYTQHDISPGAAAVHRLSSELLFELSKGQTLEDFVLATPELFKDPDITWVEWSTSGFDRRMVNQTLVNNGVPPVDFGTKVTALRNEIGIHHYSLLHGVCNLRYGGKPRKLAQAAKDLPWSEKQIESMYNRYIQPASDLGMRFHTADYDAFVSWLLMYNCGVRLRL